VDVDLHVMHHVGRDRFDLVDLSGASTNWFYYQFNWGPSYNLAWLDAFGYTTNNAAEYVRVMPDCHYNNCDACTVTVPGQPACAPASLAWNSDYIGSTFYPFVNGPAVSTDANPKLDIDNRRGCYQDALGNSVCTPENVSIKAPGPVSGTYAVAVHYWGEPVTEISGQYLGNRRGYAPPGLGRVDVDVEVFCRGVGFKRFHCAGVPVDGWCFVAAAAWNGATSQCTSLTAPVDLYGATGKTFPVALIDMTTQNPPLALPPEWDFTPGYANVLATPAP